MNGALDSSLDEELFVPLVYYKTHRHKDFSVTPKVKFDDILISNKGRVRPKGATDFEIIALPRFEDVILADKLASDACAVPEVTDVGYMRSIGAI